MRPTKIISGGQTGADQGALVAGLQLGIPTGGWMPRGFKTEDGFNPALAALYGVKEHPSPEYPPRTKQNVKDSNGTVWIGEKDGLGFLCTRNATEKYGRPFAVNPTAEELREWVTAQRIHVLNVAGPRASKDRKAHQRAAELLIEAFKDDLSGGL